MSGVEIYEVVVGSLTVVGLLYLAFGKTYFQEKGKNLATKEDIEEITRIVESVRSQLQYSLQAKISLKDLEREALLDYFAKFHAWRAAIMSYGNICMTDDEARELEEARRQLDKLKLDFDLATGIMELFVDDADIRAQQSKLEVEMINLAFHAIRTSFEIQEEHQRIEIGKPEPQTIEWLEKYSASIAKRMEMYKVSKTELVKKYSDLYPSIAAHRSSISQHLQRLIDD